MLAIVPFSTGYKIMGLLHIVAAVVAFGPLFMYASLQRAGETATIARMHMRVSFPALVLLWVFGMGLVGMSKDAFEMSDTWVALSLVVWIALMAISWFMIRPAINDVGEKARAKLASGLGVTHLLLVVALYLMIWKPGA